MRVYIRIFTLLCLILCLAGAGNVFAEEKIDVSIDYGLDGKVQIGSGFPMTVTLSTQGEDFSGDLVIYASPNYVSLGNIVIPIELSKGEESIVNFSVPGHGEQFYSQQQNRQQTLIRLFEGGWESGKEVKINTNKKFRPGYFPENRLIVGVLSDAPDTLNFLKLTHFNSEPVEMIQVKEEDLPNESTGFEIFDVLLVNDFSVTDFPVHKQQALKDWVRSGGHLMIGSNSGLSQQLGEVNDLSLLTITNQTSFEDLVFFPKKEDEQQPSFKNVDIMTGDIESEANILYADHSLPMVLNKSFGLGEVTQFVFNIGTDSLSKWDPYVKWWEEVLQKTVDKDAHGQQQYRAEDLTHYLKEVVDAFPSSFIPLKALVILFIIYLLLLVPGLYIILKKMDKRENSWWIIPSIAIISSVCIFTVGAKDRIAGNQVNEISILSIDDTGIASGYGAVSMLSSRGGSYELTVTPGEFNPFPLNSSYNDQDLQLNYAMVQKGQEQTKITFNDVEFWSIRSMLGDIQSKDIGKLAANLKVEKGKLSGSIESSLLYDLEEAFILTGSKSYSIGTVEAGTTSNIAIELNNHKSATIMGAPVSTIASSVIRGYNNPTYGAYGGSSGPTDKDGLDQWKKYELLNTVMTHEIHQKNLNQPLLVGFTNDSVIHTEINGKEGNANALTLITQTVEITPSLAGEFTLTGDVLQPDISVMEGKDALIYHNGLLYGEKFVDVEIGKYLLSYQLPAQIEMDKTTLDELRLTISRDASFYIYNTRTEEFMPLDDDQSTVSFKEEVNDFVQKDGSILLMFEKNNQNSPEIRIPTVHIEGEYKK